ncbi:hypothetical protein CcI49_06825 [Frankia sp. CcI49]|nr:hypothetical protein CcI49_06825 [Frankia sp. CcI49]
MFAVALVAAVVHLVLARCARPVPAGPAPYAVSRCAAGAVAPAVPVVRLTPTERARVIQRQAQQLGDGAPVSRAQVLAELRAGGAGSAGDGPVSPPVTPDAAPDAVVSFAAAAAELRVSVATVRRYAAPSSGKLVRLGDGVSAASLGALAGAR